MIVVSDRTGGNDGGDGIFRRVLECCNALKRNLFYGSLQITVHFMLGFREICSVTAALPLVTMFICFVSAVVFQFDDVHETHCRVDGELHFFCCSQFQVLHISDFPRRTHFNCRSSILYHR